MSEATSAAPLTVVLVHGAFADSSSWDGVIERLQTAGIQVTAAPNPLRGISHDSAYVASFLKQVPGPVLAVGYIFPSDLAIDGIVRIDQLGATLWEVAHDWHGLWALAIIYFALAVISAFVIKRRQAHG